MKFLLHRLRVTLERLNPKINRMAKKKEVDVSDEQLIEIVREVKKSREEGKYINDKVFKEIVKKINNKE